MLGSTPASSLSRWPRLSPAQGYVVGRRIIRYHSPKSRSTNRHHSSTYALEHLIVLPVIMLTIMSLLFIYSSSPMRGIYLASSSAVFVKKQLIITLACWGYLALCTHINSAIWRRIPLLSYILVLITLCGVLVPGLYPEIGGARRWLRLAGIQFQPAELAKVALILLTAKILSLPSYRSRRWVGGILPILSFFSAYAVLLLLQPDFGSTVLLASVCGAVLVVAGIPKRFILAMLGLGASGIALLIMVAPYRWNRLMVFMDPWKQPRDGGFQIIQSYLGFQNGSLWGSGFGESKQKLFFLPEAHTDFILAVIGEELGFMGVSFVVLCFVAIIFAGFRISQKQQDSFWYYVCLGVVFMLSFQTIMNMGVVMGLLPTKGIPLPFISNGASSLVAYTLMISLLLIANRRHPIKSRRLSPPPS